MDEETDYAPSGCSICGKSTREGKPYCLAHITNMPGAQEVISELERQRREIELVKESSLNVDLNSPLVNDMLRILERKGNRTLKKLSQDMQIPIRAALNYARALKRAGWVRLGSTTRKHVVVELEPTAACT